MKRKRGLYRVDSRDDKQGDAGTRTSTLPAEVFKRMQALDELLLERNKEVAKLKEEVLLYRTFNERFRITERRAALFEGARQLYTPEVASAFTIAFSQITSWSARYIFHTHRGRRNLQIAGRKGGRSPPSPPFPHRERRRTLWHLARWKATVCARPGPCHSTPLPPRLPHIWHRGGPGRERPGLLAG